MEHQFRHIEEEARNNVSHALRWLIMSRIKGIDDVILRTVACIKVVRTHSISLHTDAEELSFETRLHVRKLLG